jgi:hypothetical protein
MAKGVSKSGVVGVLERSHLARVMKPGVFDAAETTWTTYQLNKEKEEDKGLDVFEYDGPQSAKDARQVGMFIINLTPFGVITGGFNLAANLWAASDERDKARTHQYNVDTIRAGIKSRILNVHLIIMETIRWTGYNSTDEKKKQEIWDLINFVKKLDIYESVDILRL